MSPFVSYLLGLFLILFGLLAVLDLVLRRSKRRFAVQIVALVAVVLLLRLTTGFPATRRAFGGSPPELAIALMFGGIVLGMAAHYVFYLKGAFAWLDFVRPFVVSPIVLLPLIGSIQGAALGSLQLICFVILAFQNGFFWQQVLRDAKPTN